MRIKLIPTVFLLVLIASCQTEENVVQKQPSNSLTANSPLGELVSRVVQSETSFDNIIDNTNCFAIAFPYTVMANSQQVVINDTGDYQTVANIFNASVTDEDILSIVFPVTVVYQNFQQSIISNQQQFNTAVSACGDVSVFSEIDCIDFNYPITINTYDSDNQVADSVVFTGNQQLFEFLASANLSDILGIVYPVTMTMAGGQNVTVNNNDELSAAIENSIGTCDSPTTPDTLPQVIIDGTWYVSYYYHNEDETSNYNGYTFNFSPTGVVTATKNGNTYNGAWNVYQEGGQMMMDIDFNDSALGDLEDDWRVLEYSGTEVRLRQDNGGSDGDRLYFSKM